MLKLFLVFVGLLLFSFDCFLCSQNMDLVVKIYWREVVFYNNIDIISTRMFCLIALSFCFFFA